MHSCNSKIILIVAAAGFGKRMNLNYPKQFLEVRDKPILVHTLEIAEKNQLIDKIIITTCKDSIELVLDLCKKYNITKVKDVIVGGKERQYSIENALELCENNSIIAVQDSVRPFLKDRYFSEGLEFLQKNLEVDGIVIGVPLKDTIKEIDKNGYVIKTPKRENFVAVHTPQIFRGKILKEAYAKAKVNNFLGTDDSSLVERIGGKVKVLIGDYDNIKITTVEDLKLI